MTDLFPAGAMIGSGRKASGADPQKVHAPGKIVATYDYTDAKGKLLFQVCRFEPKTFRQRRPVGTGWAYDLSGIEPVLYRLPEIIEAVARGQRVYVVEGEKDADALVAHGFEATTSPMGAGKWRESYTESLRRAEVVILPDNDDAGRNHANEVAAKLHAAGCTVRIVELPGLPEKGDVSDYLTAGVGSLDQLESLIGATAPFAKPSDALAAEGERGALTNKEARFLSLATLATRPELTRPPEIVAARLAYRGRLVILAGPDKVGKSSLSRYCLAAITANRAFLNEAVRPRSGRVLSVGLEEALADAVQGLMTAKADAERTMVLTHKNDGKNLLREIIEMQAAVQFDAVSIDSLTEYARVTLGEVPDDSDTSGWAEVLRPLADFSHEADVAVLLNHHVRRSDGDYRGPGEIANAADCLLEMRRSKSTNNPNVRHITGRARWAVAPFSVELTKWGYELDGSTQSVDARVLLNVERSMPLGMSKTQLRELVGGRASVVDTAVKALLERGALVAGETGRLITPPPSLLEAVR